MDVPRAFFIRKKLKNKLCKVEQLETVLELFCYVAFVVHYWMTIGDIELAHLMKIYHRSNTRSEGNFKLNSLLYVLASPRFRANLKADLF